MTKKNKKKNRKILYRFIILLLLVISLSYVIFYTNILKPRVNELTTSYISLYTKNSTDNLKIDNISKMSDRIGKSFINNSSLDLDIDKDKSNYKIVLYKVINDIDDEYINYSIKSSDGISISISNLSECIDTIDNGKVIYEGDSKRIIIKMWVSDKYTGDLKDNSYEIKIK